MKMLRTLSFCLLALGFSLTGCGLGSSGTVDIEPGGATLAPGQTIQFSVKVTNCPDTAVNWSANGGSISSSGTYTAPLEPGTYTVFAECREDGSINDSVTVTVE
jgi:hypothetical protein